MALQIPTTAEMQNLYAMHSFVRPSAPQIHPHDSTKTPKKEMAGHGHRGKRAVQGHRAEHVDGHGYSRFCELYGQ
jgi:hypothetical protein